MWNPYGTKELFSCSTFILTVFGKEAADYYVTWRKSMVILDDLILKIEDIDTKILTAPERDTIIDALILYKEMN